MAKFRVDGQGTNTASTTLLYFVNGATARLLMLYDMVFGSDAAPVDQAAEYGIRKVTAENMTPGGTAVTPSDLNQANNATANSNAVEDPSGEPTMDAGEFLNIALHQRATFRMPLNPGSELISAATADNGWAWFATGVTSAYNAVGTMLYEE